MREYECRHCGEGFIPEHGNRRYCTEECYMEAKKKRNREKYAAVKLSEPVRKNDSILAKSYKSGKKVVNRWNLRVAGFEESYFMRTLKTKQGEKVYAMGLYGVSYIDEHKLKIHRISYGGN